MAKIAVLGHGVVGSGVVEVLDTNAAGIAKKAGETIEIKWILDRRDFADCKYSEKFTKDFSVILADEEVAVVVEVMGGINPAYDFVKDSLLAGKSVVTSNKELVAAHGAELLALAAQSNVNFLFEASVGGGIPIINPLHLCLGANKIEEIAGILNGTTNYILTKMIREGVSFADALKTAQQLGYAEANPAADVEGGDACRKICILAALAFGKHVYPDAVYTEGITKITLEDVAYASGAGYAIKLVGRAKPSENGDVALMVSPVFLPVQSQLAGIDDVFNGVLVRGNATGDVLFYGKGAGKLPTASAVMSDVIDSVRACGTIPTLTWEDSDNSHVADYLEQPVRAYVRLSGEPGAAAAKAASLLGEVDYLTRAGQSDAEVAVITPIMTEAALQTALDKLEDAGIAVLGRIRLLDI